MKICLLASGSKGNAIYMDSGSTRLLVDAGLSAAELKLRLASIGVDPSSLNGILISHEHGDHIRGAGVMARRYRLPLLASDLVVADLQRLVGKTETVTFAAGSSFAFRDIQIEPFPITHDAADPVGFVIESREGRLGIATDLGIATRLVQARLAGCRALVLEANHDEELLQNGPYPWHLKQRIRSRHGHLSNAEAGALLEELLHPDLEGLFLAHLSETNNNPALARDLFSGLLSRQTICSPRFFIGTQSVASELCHFT